MAYQRAISNPTSVDIMIQGCHRAKFPCRNGEQCECRCTAFTVLEADQVNLVNLMSCAFKHGYLVLFSIRSWRSTYSWFWTISFVFNGIPAPTGKPAVWMGRAAVLGLFVIGMCCELCVKSCTGTIMSVLAGVHYSPSLLPGSVGAALVGDTTTCAYSAAPGGNVELAALAGGALLLEVYGRWWLRKWLLQCHMDDLLHLCHPVLRFFNDCRCQMYHSCLDGIHQALLQVRPNWCHIFWDITNGRWARWRRCPSNIVADHEISQSAWECLCSWPMLGSWCQGCWCFVWCFAVTRLGPRFLAAGYFWHALEQVLML